MPARIGVLTSGGDAQGMNAAVRSIVRSAIHRDAAGIAVSSAMTTYEPTPEGMPRDPRGPATTISSPGFAPVAHDEAGPGSACV